MAAMNMNQEQFEQAIREEKPVLVDFWAPWCSYCRRIGPAYEKIGEEYADSLAVGKINIDEEPQLAGAEGIEVIPTLVYSAANDLCRNSADNRIIGNILCNNGAGSNNAAVSDMNSRHERNSVAEPYVVTDIYGLFLFKALQSHGDIRSIVLMISCDYRNVGAHHNIVSDMALAVNFCVYSDARVISERCFRRKKRILFNIDVASALLEHQPAAESANCRLTELHSAPRRRKL